jgi:predicted AAA+ superfamily ATPase
LASAVRTALADTPVVCLLGPRQCGKSTLAMNLEPDRGYVTLDIRKDRIDTEYVFVPAAGVRSAKESGRKKLSVAHGARRLEV